MSSLESNSPETCGEIENLAHSIAIVRNNEFRSPRTTRQRVRSEAAREMHEIEPADRSFVDHTDSLEQVRLTQREIVGSKKEQGGGGPEDFPDPYYTPNP